MVATARLARRYPLVAATILIGLVGVLLGLLGWEAAVQWLFSGFALVVAFFELVRMVRSILRGHWGLDILLAAIIATVLVGEFVASLIIVLMLTGGEALEDYAAGRAQRELNALLERVPQVAHVFT